MLSSSVHRRTSTRTIVRTHAENESPQSEVETRRAEANCPVQGLCGGVIEQPPVRDNEQPYGADSALGAVTTCLDSQRVGPDAAGKQPQRNGHVSHHVLTGR